MTPATAEICKVLAQPTLLVGNRCGLETVLRELARYLNGTYDRSRRRLTTPSITVIGIDRLHPDSVRGLNASRAFVLGDCSTEMMDNLRFCCREIRFL